MWLVHLLELYHIHEDFPGGSVVKNSAKCRRPGFDPWVWQPTAVCLPGEFHGQRDLVGYSPWGPKRVGRDWAHTHSSTNITSYPIHRQQNSFVKIGFWKWIKNRDWILDRCQAPSPYCTGGRLCFLSLRCPALSPDIPTLSYPSMPASWYLEISA